MIDYTLSIDTSGGKDPNGYFTIDTIQLNDADSDFIDGARMVERRALGEIEVKNLPYEYQKLGGSKYNLYDIISSVQPNQEIYLKFVSAYETIYAYFGVIDCKLDFDKRKITIKPYILDQYTDLLENKDTEVKLFDETNQIVNGDFKEWTGSNPNGWTNIGSAVLEKSFILDTSAISIKNKAVTGINDKSGIKLTSTNILAQKGLAISFLYALSGSGLDRENLECEISIKDVNVGTFYYLDINGKWTINYTRIKFANQLLPLDVSSVSWNKFAISAQTPPITGEFNIYFYHYHVGFSDIATYLLLNSVIVSTSSIELKTIKIQLSATSLVTKNEDAPEITWAKKKTKANFYSTRLNYQTSLDTFFDGNGKPIDGNLIMSDDNGVQISDVIRFFQEQTSPSYKFELSKITIFKCEYIATKKRRYRAICEFSREETYYMAKDSNGNDLPDVPPEADSGWYNTNTKEGGRNLWIRTPFNGIVLPWVKSAIDVGNWRTYKSGFGYYDSITSVKQYPVTVDKSVEITNAIDLREIFTKVYRETHISLRGKNVYSNFLWNDALSVQETADVYINNDTATNYVTMTDATNDLEPKNELNKIVAVHTYEFSTEPATDKEKTILKITFDELMTDFLAHFPQCYYFVDTNKDLHIEHVKYFDRINQAKDLTTATYDYIRQYQNWEYLKEKLFSLETYEFKNSGNLDFIDSEVTFDKIATNKRGQDVKNEITGKVFSTDVAFCMENRNSLDNGIVLMIYDTVGGDNICRSGVGQKSGSSIINGDLSIASLLAKYATYEGTWKQGQINKKGFWNNQDGVYDFKTTKHVRQGEEITIKGIFLDKIIFTNLGLGIITQRKVDYENEITKVVAMYRYSDPFPVYGSGKDNPII